jgi:hypothetical protein
VQHGGEGHSFTEKRRGVSGVQYVYDPNSEQRVVHRWQRAPYVWQLTHSTLKAGMPSQVAHAGTLTHSDRVGATARQAPHAALSGVRAFQPLFSDLRCTP